MTIPETAQLVIQAGATVLGGDVFVLDMGRPVRILDLALPMIELSGSTLRNEENPEGDIEVEIVGLRPGEKLYEELLSGDDPCPTPHKRIMKAHEPLVPWSKLAERLSTLDNMIGWVFLHSDRCTRCAPPTRGELRSRPRFRPFQQQPE